MDDISIRVNMSGEEYIKYKEHKKGFFNFKWTNKHTGAVIMLVSLLALLTIPIIHEVLYPPEPVSIGYSNLWGITIHNGLIIWFAITIGIAWMSHGFGFIIIKR